MAETTIIKNLEISEGHVTAGTVKVEYSIRLKNGIDHEVCFTVDLVGMPTAMLLTLASGQMKIQSGSNNMKERSITEIRSEFENQTIGWRTYLYKSAAKKHIDLANAPVEELAAEIAKLQALMAAKTAPEPEPEPEPEPVEPDIKPDIEA